jgi:hypothetical protein
VCLGVCSSPRKLFHSSTDKQKFHDLVNQNIDLKISFKITQKIDDAVNNFKNIIQTGTWDTSTTHRQHVNNSPSIPEHIRILIANKRKARALYQQYRLPSFKRNFNNLENPLKKIFLVTKIKLKSTTLQICHQKTVAFG